MHIYRTTGATEGRAIQSRQTSHKTVLDFV